MKKIILVFSLLILTIAADLRAEAPNLLTYQGRLKEGGQAVTGTRLVEIKLCDAEANGNCYSTNAQNVNVSNGLFRSTFSVPVAANFGAGAWYLEIWVNSVQLTPRERLTSTAYSMFSATAAYATNLSAAMGSDGVYISSNIYVTSGGKYYGDGSELGGVTASSVAANGVKAGLLNSDVIASSIAVGAVQDASIISVSASKLTGPLPALDGGALTNVNSVQNIAVAADTTTIAGNLAAEVTSRGSADSALSVQLNVVAVDTTSLKGQVDLKADLASPAFTGTVSGITSAMVGLGSVANVDQTDAANITSGILPLARLSGITDAELSASAAIADTKLATIATALKVSNSATTAASANTAGAIVARDASGNFTAGTITAATFIGNVNGSAASVAWTAVTSKPLWMQATLLTSAMANANKSMPSGFYEANAGTNYPTTGTWYTLINSRRQSASDDHGFQIAASFYDENVWTRTYQGGTGNNDGTYTPWKKLVREENGPWAIGITGNAATASTATSLAGGLANQLPYQSGSGTTIFLAAPGANSVLFADSGTPAWSNTPTLTGTNITGVPWAGVLKTGSSLSDLAARSAADLDSGILPLARLSGINITSAEISATAAIADTQLATIATSGKVSNSATTAASANTASAIVARDASGNFTAGTITASSFSGVLSGNSATATTADNLGGGLANQMPYQTGLNTTAFIGAPGTDMVLSGSGGAPYWTTTPVFTGTNITGLPWTGVLKTGSSLADLATRSASDLDSGTLAVPYGGTGAATLTGFVRGSGTSALTASAIVDADVPDNISINGTDNVTWASVDKAGSSLGDLATRSAASLDSGILPLARLSAITNTEIAAAAAIADTKLATIATGGKVFNSATTAASANTASAIVARDASGNFTAGTITAATFTGALNGNAATVTTNANLTGDVTSIGNATTLTNAPVIAKVLTGFTPNAGTVAASDSILQAIQKIDGNAALKAPLASPTFTGTVSGITSAMVGLGSVANVDQTDAANITSGILPLARLSGINITSAEISAAAAIADTQLATIATSGKVSNSATTAASANTASAIVARDASGNFTAGTITAISFSGAIVGNADTATTATNLAGGDANQLPYQSAAGATTFVAAPGANMVLTASSGAPGWSNTPTFTGTNISGVPWSGVLKTNSSLADLATRSAADLDSGVLPLARLSGVNITSAEISATAAIADTQLATIATSGKVSNSATTAASANTASAIVARDASGNFTAGTITASSFSGVLSGNSATATTADNLAGGAANQVPYQSGAGTTVFVAVPEANSVLSANAGAPSWTNTPALTGTNITGLPWAGVLKTGSSLADLETRSAANLDSGILPLARLTGITAVELAADAGILDTQLDTISSAGKVANSATTADSTNMGDAIVTRDASGNFMAGTITANAFVGDGSGLTGVIYSTAALQGQIDNVVLSTGMIDADLQAYKNVVYISTSGIVLSTGVINADLQAYKTAVLTDTTTLRNVKADNSAVVHSTGDVMTGGLVLANNSTMTVTGSAFSVGGTTLVVASGKIGIGTTSPDQTLTVAGNISQTGILVSSGTGNNYFAGKLGVGVVGPTNQLEVASPGGSNLQLDTSNSAYASVKMNGVEAGRVRPGELEAVDKLTVDGYSLFKGSVTVSGSGFTVGGSTLVVSGGNVGIGTTAPTARLDVRGGSINTQYGISAATGVFSGSLAASSFTATGTGISATQLRLADNIVISTETIPLLGGGVRISTNIYIVGFSSAAKYYGDGSGLTGVNTASPVGSALTSANIWVGNASNQAAATGLTGDVTINNTGVTAIGAGKVTNTMLAGSITDSNLATIATSGKVSNSATTADSANAASAIVARDSSGNFTAGTITAALVGNVTGNASGTAANITGNLAAAQVAAGALPADVRASSIALAGFYSDDAVRSNLGLAIGTNVQAYDADLSDLADGSLSGSLVGSGVPAANIAAGSLGAGVIASSIAAGAITSENQIADGTIANADLAGSIADTKLDQITAVSKVSGAALTSLASVPSGAGALPAANLPSDGYASTYVNEGQAGSIATGMITDGTIIAADIAVSTISLDRLNQSGCTSNQVPKWNGSAWACSADNNTTYTADEISLHLSGDTFSALASSVTLQGNIFNAADKLVQLDGSAKLPALDASQVVKVSSLAVGAINSEAQIVDGTITNADLAGTIADTKLATIATANKVSNSATTATDANTVNAIVARDSSGNFTAGVITATAYLGSGAGLAGVITSTATLQAQIDNVAVSTGAISASTGTIAGNLAAEIGRATTRENDISLSTGAIAASTGAINADLQAYKSIVYADTTTLRNVKADNSIVVHSTGDVMTGDLLMANNSTITVTGNSFSVGGAAFVVAAGNVGVGTAAPDEKLHVVGTVKATKGVAASTGAFTSDVSVAGNFSANSGLGNSVNLSSTVVYGTLQVTGGISSAQGAPAYLSSTQTFAGSNTFKDITVSSAAAVTGNSGVYGLTVSSNVALAGALYTANGNVGIGTTEPAGMLTIYDLTLNRADQIRLGANATIDYRIGRNTSDGFFEVQGSQTGAYSGFRFKTPAAGTPFTISNPGNVGIGTTDPDQKLTVAGNISQAGVIISSGIGNSYFAGNVGIGTAAPQGLFQVGGGSLTVLANGKVGVGTASPGARLDIVESDTANSSYTLRVGTGTNSYSLVVATNGWVGLGNNSPKGRLHLAGTGMDSGIILDHTAAPGGDIWNAPWITAVRSRPTAPGTVGNDDGLGAFIFMGSDGGGGSNGPYAQSAAIRAVVDGEVGTGSVPGRLEFYTSAGAAGLAARLVIKSDGMVGISTGNPQAALDVLAPGGYPAQIWRNSAGLAVATMTADGQLYANIPNDGLGNHIATTSLDMAGYAVVNVSTIGVTGLDGGIVIAPYLDKTLNYAYTQGVAIGSNTYDNYSYGVGIGYYAYGNSGGGVGVGNNSHGNSDYGVGVGNDTPNNYTFGVGIGNNASGNYNAGVGVGSGASGNKDYAVGIGANSSGNKTYGSALGAYSYAASSSVALGSYANANAKESIAIGAGTVNNSERTASFGAYSINTSSSITAYALTISTGFGPILAVSTAGVKIGDVSYSSQSVLTVQGLARDKISGTQDISMAIDGTMRTSGTGAEDIAAGGNFEVDVSGSDQVSMAGGLRTAVRLNSSSYAKQAIGLMVDSLWSNGTIDDTYGIYIGTMTSGTQTNTPFALYSADSNAAAYFAGKVGIGTASPGFRLEVKDAARGAIAGFSGSSDPTDAAVYGWANNGAAAVKGVATGGYAGRFEGTVLVGNTLTAANGKLSVWGTGPAYTLSVSTDTAGGTANMVVDNSGNVGIGTASPAAKLEVTGGAIKATGGLIIETRTSDPAVPATGQMWLRVD